MVSATIQESLSTATELLVANVDRYNAKLEAELLLAFTLGESRTFLFTWPEFLLTSDQVERFKRLISARCNGEPVAYLLGHREFWSLSLSVMPGVLIPRPETEHLVDKVLEILPVSSQEIVDLGTGSGAIALALAKERSQWKLLATDSSELTLECAKRNAKKLGLTNVKFALGNWYSALPAGAYYDLIVSNPPYIDPEDDCLNLGDLRFEPRSALVAADKGEADLEEIITKAPNWLLPQGWLALEHGNTQSRVVTEMLMKAGFQNIQTIKDYAGHDRCTLAKNTGSKSP